MHPPAHQIADGPVLSGCKIHLGRSQLAAHLLALPYAQLSRREAASPAPRASPKIWTSVDVHVPYDLRLSVLSILVPWNGLVCARYVIIIHDREALVGVWYHNAPEVSLVVDTRLNS